MQFTTMVRAKIMCMYKKWLHLATTKCSSWLMKGVALQYQFLQSRNWIGYTKTFTCLPFSPNMRTQAYAVKLTLVAPTRKNEHHKCSSGDVQIYLRYSQFKCLYHHLLATSLGTVIPDSQRYPLHPLTANRLEWGPVPMTRGAITQHIPDGARAQPSTFGILSRPWRAIWYRNNDKCMIQRTQLDPSHNQ